MHAVSLKYRDLDVSSPKARGVACCRVRALKLPRVESKYDPKRFNFGAFDRHQYSWQRCEGATFEGATFHPSSQPRSGPAFSASTPRPDASLRRSIQARQRMRAFFVGFTFRRP